jgi:hypothetical protein
MMAMADAPSSISPTLPRKAVSVRPIICSITRLIRMGYATFQIFLYEYVPVAFNSVGYNYLIFS